MRFWRPGRRCGRGDGCTARRSVRWRSVRRRRGRRRRWFPRGTWSGPLSVWVGADVLVLADGHLAGRGDADDVGLATLHLLFVEGTLADRYCDFGSVRRSHYLNDFC